MERVVRARTCVGALLTAAASLALAAGPASANGSPQHFDNTWTEQDISQVDGIGPGCPAFVGTLEEDLTGADVGFLAADAIAHVHTTVNATVTLTPDDPAAASFDGSYTMIQTGIYPEEGEATRVVTRTVNGTINGSDGSSYNLHETLHLTVDGQGRPRADFDRMTCS